MNAMLTLPRDGMTMIVVTHETGFAAEVAGRVSFLDHGVAIEHGSPAEGLGNPDHERTRDFLQRVPHSTP